MKIPARSPPSGGRVRPRRGRGGSAPPTPSAGQAPLVVRANPMLGRYAVTVCCIVHNEMYFLPAFLAYYRAARGRPLRRPRRPLDRRHRATSSRPSPT